MQRALHRPVCFTRRLGGLLGSFFAVWRQRLFQLMRLALVALSWAQFGGSSWPQHPPWLTEFPPLRWDFAHC